MSQCFANAHNVSPMGRMVKARRRIRAAVAEVLETRRLLAFTAQLGAANFAGFTGDGSSDGIQIDSNGSFLMHSRSGDPGFASEFDFDSIQAGEQKLADDAGNSVLILAGGGNDQLSLGSATFAALDLKANILFQGEAGTDTVFVFDLISSANRTVLISDQAAVSAIAGFNGGAGVAQFNSVDQINYFGGSGSDTVSLLNLQATSTVNINTAGGADAIAIGGFDANAGTVNVDGGSAADSFTVLDVAETSASTYTINSGSVARGALSYSHSNIEQVALAGGTAADTINIVSSSAAVVAVDGAGAGDAYNVGNAGSLDSIAGAVSIVDSGASGSDTVVVNDANDLTDNTYILIAAGVLRAGNPQIGYVGVEGVTVSTGQGNDSVSVAETQTAPTNIFTGNGNDIIALAGATNGLIDADGGTNDVLDYSFAPVGVTVNLATGAATGTTGVGGFEGVIGSTFNDDITVAGTTVLGNAGDDVINLLGSAGATLVDGGEGGDAVILRNAALSMDNFLALVTIADSGTAGNDVVLLDDSGETDGNSYTFVASGVLRNGNPLATYSGVESVTLGAGSGADVIFVAESQTVPLAIFSGDGNDTIGLAGFTNGTINADGGVDTLDYSAAPIGVFADLQNGIALGTAGIAGFEVVNGSAFEDSFVASDLGSTLNGNGGNDILRGGAGSDVLNGNAGNDDLAGLGGVDAIDGGDDDDTIGFTNVDGLDFVEGGNGNDQLFVLGAAADADSVSIANNLGRLNVVGSLPIPFGVDAAGIETANIILQGGNDVATVISSVAGQQLNIAGGDDDDIFIVDSDGSGTASGGTVDGVAGPIFITGDGGTNILALDDSGDTTADAVTVTPTEIGSAPGDTFFGGGTLSYAGLKSVTLYTSNASTGDQITVTPSETTEFSINAQSPVNPTVNPDKLSLNLAGALNGTVFPTGDDGFITFTNRASIAYTSVERVTGGAFQFSSPTYVVNENGATAVVTVTRILGSDEGASVEISTSDGTAIDGSDYTGQTIRLEFAPGVTQQSIAIPITNDSTDEFDETINLSIGNVFGNALLVGGKTTGVVTILDNDPLPTLSISDVSKSEGNSNLTTFTFNVTLSAASEKPITVNYGTSVGTATNLVDFLPELNTLTFAPGETSKTITIGVVGDLNIENNETFFVGLVNPTNVAIADAVGVGTILNDDFPTELITDPNAAGATALRVTGTNSNDQIVLTKDKGNVVVSINGVAQGSFSFNGGIYVFGLNGNDTITVNSAIKSNTFIFGGDGNDIISGGGGSDVVAGGSGIDAMMGNDGRDLILGGAAADLMNGGGDDDILVGGSSIHDGNLVALGGLLAEWTRTDLNYAQRSDHIINGSGLNGSTVLSTGTIDRNPGENDSIAGAGASDLFFANTALGDVLTDRIAPEILTSVINLV